MEIWKKMWVGVFFWTQCIYWTKWSCIGVYMVCFSVFILYIFWILVLEWSHSPYESALNSPNVSYRIVLLCPFSRWTTNLISQCLTDWSSRSWKTWYQRTLPSYFSRKGISSVQIALLCQLQDRQAHYASFSCAVTSRTGLSGGRLSIFVTDARVRQQRSVDTGTTCQPHSSLVLSATEHLSWHFNM